MNLVVHSERTLISLESFPKMKREILELQVEERIRPLGPWPEDISLFHCMHLLNTGSTTNSYVIVSLPEQDISTYIEQVQDEGVRLNLCVPHIVSISALTGQLTEEPVMACFLANGYLEILVAEGGFPLYSQISPLDDKGYMDEDLLAQAIFNVRQIIGAKYNKNIRRLLYFDKKNTNLPESIGEDKVWYPEPGFLANPQQRKLVWKHPELIGTLFVHKDFNCIPLSLKTSYIIQDINKAAAAFSLAGILILGGSGLFLSAEHAKAQARYRNLFTKLQMQKEQIASRMPSRTEIKNVSQIAAVLQELAGEPSIDALLYQLAKDIPEGVLIETLKAERVPTQKAQLQGGEEEVPPPDKFTEPLPIPESSVEKKENDFFKNPLVVHLRLLTLGDFQLVKKRLENAADMLARDFDMTNVRFGYVEKKNSGHLECDLTISGNRT